MANQIKIVVTTEDKGASKNLVAIGNAADDTAERSNKLSGSLGALGVTLGHTTLALGATGAAALSAGTVLGFQFNSSVEQAQAKLMAFMKDGDKVAETLAWVKGEAAQTQFSFTEMADAAANLTPVAKSSGQSLQDLIKQAEILAALNPAEGLTGATFSLREALSGDWVSIVDRFNLPRQRINQLKAEGVPAMEIISRTLNEMGIDYTLVAKQGQTVAARFDQVKDKLTMMAGAATKPIFDRVSKELDTLGAYDFQGLGDNLAAVVGGAIGAVDEFMPKVRALADQVGAYLGPKLQALGIVISEQVMPALGRLWKEVIEPLLPVLGQAFVGALGLAIDALTMFLGATTQVINYLMANQGVVWGIVAALAAFKGALLINDAKDAFGKAMDFMGGKWTDLNTKISTPMVMPAIAVGAALVALGLVIDEAGKANDAVQGAQNSINELEGQLKTNKALYERLYKEGKISADDYKNKIADIDREIGGITERRKEKIYTGFFGPLLQSFSNLQNSMEQGKWAPVSNNYGGFATGGFTGRGGTYEPAGIVHRGEYVIPKSQVDQSTGMPKAGAAGGHTVIIQQMNINNGGDQYRMLSDIGFALELAS